MERDLPNLRHIGRATTITDHMDACYRLPISFRLQSVKSYGSNWELCKPAAVLSPLDAPTLKLFHLLWSNPPFQPFNQLHDSLTFYTLIRFMSIFLNHEFNTLFRRAIAALRAQPESVCPECHCHFTSNEVTAPGATRLVNTAQPDHIELVNRLQDVAGRYPEDGYVMYVCNQAIDALDAIGETK